MVQIVEVGPRDGLQNQATPVDTFAKIGFIERIVASGVRRIEATSFVHPRLVPQMSDAEQVMAGVPRDRDVSYSGLVLNARGFDRAVLADVDEINVVVVATDTFAQRNQGMSLAGSLSTARDLVERAHNAGLPVTVTVGAAFGCPFEGEVGTDQLLGVLEEVVRAGPDELALADTIGVGVPRDVRDRVRLARSLTDAPLRCHFHNTRNSGYANAVAAIEEGVAALDSSAGGIGGCPFAPDATGNIGTEDLLYLLARSGVETGIDLELAMASARFIGARIGGELPALLTRAGAFPNR